MTANCSAGWQWSYNSYGQNPCLVAGIIEATCRNISGFVIPPLNASENYLTPQPGDLAGATCDCNTVMYSLFMGCTACQNMNLQNWSYWDTNCLTVYVSQYPGRIPQGTAIPHWAYLNVTVENVFNRTLAQAAGINPQGTPVAITTINSSSPTPSTSSSSMASVARTSSGAPSGASSGTSSSSSSTPPSSHSSTNTGAIAGGVVGGIACLAIIGGLIAWYLLRKKRSSNAEIMNTTQEFDYPQSSYYPQTTQARLYNSSDPSTFPPSVEDMLSNNSGGQFAPLQYNGTPELWWLYCCACCYYVCPSKIDPFPAVCRMIVFAHWYDNRSRNPLFILDDEFLQTFLLCVLFISLRLIA